MAYATELKRWLFPIMLCFSSAPLLVSGSKALGIRLDNLKQIMDRTQKEGIMVVIGTGHLGTGNIFHDVCGERVRSWSRA